MEDRLETRKRSEAGSEERSASSADAPPAASTSSPRHTSPQAAPEESSRFGNGSHAEAYSAFLNDPRSSCHITAPPVLVTDLSITFENTVHVHEGGEIRPEDAFEGHGETVAVEHLAGLADARQIDSPMAAPVRRITGNYEIMNLTWFRR